MKEIIIFVSLFTFKTQYHMKILMLIVTIMITVPMWLNAQTPGSQPKIRVTPGFLSKNYELGDKDVTTKEVGLHLDKYSPEAYYDWKRSRSLGTQSLIWSIVGLTGMIVGVTSDNEGVQLGGYSAAVVGFGASLVCVIGSGSKEKKAIKTYNLKFGY